MIDQKVIMKLIDAQISSLDKSEIKRYAVELCETLGWSIDKAMSYIKSKRFGI